MDGTDTLPPAAEVASRARAVLDANWVDAGYCVPNPSTYPFRWLWDSCFHAVAWAHLGEPERAVRELESVFATQDLNGFAPHVDYRADPDVHAAFWGRRGASSITQPPMYGHALAELARLGHEPPRELVERAKRGLHFLVVDRARDASTGLITVVHPWETGADDSPRWDHWCQPTFDPARWYECKGSLVQSIERDGNGAPLANPAFRAAPASFNALVAFNLDELATVSGDDRLATASRELAGVLGSRWNTDLRTWVDAGPASASSGRIRTNDALLPALVLDGEPAAEARRQLIDHRALGAAYGPSGVHRDEPSYSPSTYWRGSSWPQLTYLHWVGASRAGDVEVADQLAASLVAGAWRSGFAEHWNPDTGEPLGARPQSWTALAAVVALNHPWRAASGAGA